MSKITELLAAKRANQIARMEGHSASDRAVDEKLAKIKLPKEREYRPKKAKLRTSRHAEKRMSQRGITHHDVRTIWYFGECFSSGDDVAYQVTEKALSEAPGGAQRKLSRLGGVVIIITHDDYNGYPVLKTVLRDGEDTHFTKT